LHRIAADLKFEKGAREADDDRSIRGALFPWPLRRPFSGVHSEFAALLRPAIMEPRPYKRPLASPKAGGLILLYDNCNVFAAGRVYINQRGFIASGEAPVLCPFWRELDGFDARDLPPAFIP